MQRRPELMIVNGALAGRRLTVPPGGLRVGRSSQNDVAVPDEEMSRNHCLFTAEGETIAVTDLASANGTMVNGVNIQTELRRLKPGDIVEIGATYLRVTGEVPESAPAGEVDLGLEPATAAPSAEGEAVGAPKSRRKLVLNLLWAFTAVMLVAAAVLILSGTGADGTVAAGGDRPRPAGRPESVRAAKIVSLWCEKVDADARRVFSSRMSLDATGRLHVGIDDIPAANRHVDKCAKLGAEALARLNDIFGRTEFFKLDDAYQGPSPQDENALSSRRIRVVMGDGRIKDVLVENVLEPDGFKALRERLEAFAMNELGIRAIQYSREQLIELSRGAVRTGDAKWEERNVEYGNIAAAVRAYREAVVYLETVNPKPDDYPALKDRLTRCEAELSRRYRDQRFIAERAIKLEDWATAQVELRKLCDMVPDKGDERHDEANAKLLDVEARMKKRKGGRDR